MEMEGNTSYKQDISTAGGSASESPPRTPDFRTGFGISPDEIKATPKRLRQQLATVRSGSDALLRAGSPRLRGLRIFQR